MQRLSTGVPGLDRILEGGLLEAGVYIIQGPPGAGKTTLANHLCFNQAADGRRAVYLTLLTESHQRMLAHLQRMAFFDEHAIPERVYYLGGFRALEADGLDGLVKLIGGALQKHRPALLVIDGLVSAQESAVTPRVFKKFIHEVQTAASLARCTVLMLTNSERTAGVFPEHTMVDGVLHLTDELSELRPLRHIRVLKLRGSAPLRGLHTVTLSDAGFEVTPRIETQFGGGHVSHADSATGDKLAFGIPELDRMLRGGLRAGSITMVLGSSGSGKTLLGMQFLAEGLRRGEPGVFFGFYERPEAILAKCKRVGIGGIAEGVEKGIAHMVWQRPVEGEIDAICDRLLRAVRETHATRLFLDGMQGFEMVADFHERLPVVYAAVAHELARLGVTTVYTTEIRALFSATLDVPIIGLSASTQNILVLRHIEHQATLLRALMILKIRDDDYDARMREIRITDQGIRLLDTFVQGTRLAAGGGNASTGVDGRRE